MPVIQGDVSSCLTRIGLSHMRPIQSRFLIRNAQGTPPAPEDAEEGRAGKQNGRRERAPPHFPFSPAWRRRTSSGGARRSGGVMRRLPVTPPPFRGGQGPSEACAAAPLVYILRLFPCYYTPWIPTALMAIVVRPDSTPPLLLACEQRLIWLLQTVLHV